MELQPSAKKSLEIVHRRTTFLGSGSCSGNSLDIRMTHVRTPKYCIKENINVVNIMKIKTLLQD